MILRLVLPLALVVAFLLSYHFLRQGQGQRLVVYCAHDSIYAQEILDAFQEKTGIPVWVRYDTEATKSLSLVEQLVREKDSPRCDVFWNNELLGTMDLADRGMLEPYKGAGFARIPEAFKDTQARWVGFAARLRVYIVNTGKLQPTPDAVRAALLGDLSRVALAKPLYGTTLTHYTVLSETWGLPKLKSWHEDLRRRGIREVTGNATVKNLVAEGVCDLGFTDSDDFFVAKDEGKPVAMLPVRLEDGRVISIPNAVCIVKGTRRLEWAGKLVDYVLSEEVELALANSKSRQVPLGPVDAERLSDEVRELARWANDRYPLGSLGQARADCLGWLKSEYLK